MSQDQNSCVLGIDLGTSHSALAFWQQGQEEVRMLAVSQLQAPGALIKKPVLPSVTYLPHEGEISEDLARLPWESAGMPTMVQGVWARDRGTEVPDRYISSAKSWLCSSSVDRKSAVLPWQSEVTGKLSPVEALTGYLRHLRQAFIHEMTSESEGNHPVLASSVVLTVPASFDEVARNLTREAARDAGFFDVQLLEEPQAAFYSWIGSNEHNWRDQVKPGDLVLVCDVGGGTTDFSLISVHEKNGELGLERISVGDHLLLGGDNMDLALAYHVKKKLEISGQKTDRWQFRALINAVRAGKEQLLSNPDLDGYPIAVASRGSGLFSGSLSYTLQREEVEEVIMSGFVPETGPEDFPAPRQGMGFQELGLNYESEPAISRHLARFLQRSRQNALSDAKLSSLLKDSDLQNPDQPGLLLPSAVLFNGGVFKAGALKDRILNILNSWSREREIRELTGGELDLAVAYGAAYLGRSRRSGHGIRIASGIARSYYLGLESLMMAVPGIEPEVKGLCVVPQGTEEGAAISLPEKHFALVTGQKVSFRFFSSPVRAGDQAGTLVGEAPENLDETSRLELCLPPMDDGKEGQQVPVRLQATISEVGVLQLSMQHIHSEKKWDLEFNVRPRY